MLKQESNVMLAVRKRNPSRPQAPEMPALSEEVPPVFPRDGSVTVMSGATTRELQVARQRVGDVRQLLKETFNIADTAVAIVNGQEAAEDQVLNPNDQLEFVKRAGSKGAHGWAVP